mmetsp:Transcript_12423/g.29511  ORF Transcript_12423/g.29511 Transcript_12423/m.29511 type:complete len:218 (-) Transcript_12423:348-1001(-)
MSGWARYRGIERVLQCASRRLRKGFSHPFRPFTSPPIPSVVSFPSLGFISSRASSSCSSSSCGGSAVAPRSPRPPLLPAGSRVWLAARWVQPRALGSTARPPARERQGAPQAQLQPQIRQPRLRASAVQSLTHSPRWLPLVRWMLEPLSIPCPMVLSRSQGLCLPPRGWRYLPVLRPPEPSPPVVGLEVLQRIRNLDGYRDLAPPPGECCWLDPRSV